MKKLRHYFSVPVATIWLLQGLAIAQEKQDIPPLEDRAVPAQTTSGERSKSDRNETSDKKASEEKTGPASWAINKVFDTIHPQTTNRKNNRKNTSISNPNLPLSNAGVHALPPLPEALRTGKLFFEPVAATERWNVIPQWLAGTWESNAVVINDRNGQRRLDSQLRQIRGTISDSAGRIWDRRVLPYKKGSPPEIQVVLNMEFSQQTPGTFLIRSRIVDFHLVQNTNQIANIQQRDVATHVSERAEGVIDVQNDIVLTDEDGRLLDHFFSRGVENRIANFDSSTNLQDRSITNSFVQFLDQQGLSQDVPAVLRPTSVAPVGSDPTADIQRTRNENRNAEQKRTNGRNQTVPSKSTPRKSPKPPRVRKVRPITRPAQNDDLGPTHSL